MTPPHAPRRLVIATGESPLAMWQARHVQARLQQLYPRAAIELAAVESRAEPDDVGGHAEGCGRGIEIALRDGRADVSAHCLQHVPAPVGDGFAIAAIEARDDAREALISNRHATLEAMPPDAVIGTTSLACEAQLRERYPALASRSVRAHAAAWLRSVDEGELDGVIVPASIARALGLADRVRELVDPAVLLPPPGQGALALRCLAERTDVAAWLAPLDDRAASLAVAAERAFAQPLSGNRHTPLAAHAAWQEGTLWLRGVIASRDGRQVLRGEREAPVLDVEEAEALGSALADDLLAHGAGRLILND